MTNMNYNEWPCIKIGPKLFNLVIFNCVLQLNKGWNYVGYQMYVGINLVIQHKSMQCDN